MNTQTTVRPEMDLALWAARAISGVFDKLGMSNPDMISIALDMLNSHHRDLIREWAMKTSQR